MTLRPCACNAAITLASFSNRSMSYMSTSKLRSTGISLNCHCQRNLTEGFHQLLWLSWGIGVAPRSGDGGANSGRFTMLQAIINSTANATHCFWCDLIGVPFSGDNTHRLCLIIE